MSFKKNFRQCGVAALAVAGAFVVLPAMAADHTDGAAAVADPSSDINDVYAFMNEENLVLGMTVHPFADADAVFSDAVQFTWHVNAWGAFTDSLAGGPEFTTTVQCEFDAAQMIQCWIHRDGEILDYVMGDASSEEGVAGESSQVFAGLRSDPFYFYLSGFNAARGAVISEVTAGNVDIATNGTLCPELTDGQLDALGDALTASGPGAQDLNDFLGANTLAIVLEVDKALFTDAENTVVSVHATTHAKP